MINRKECMKFAIKEGKKSKHEGGRTDPTPRVGAVLELAGKILSAGFRGKTGPGDHAEYGLLKKGEVQEGFDLSRAVLYTTLEPCTIRNPPKTPCAQHIVSMGIGEVVIGVLDPNRTIQGDGYYYLEENDVKVSFFDSEFRKEIKEDNKDFFNHYHPRTWQVPMEVRSLDDWYFALNAIYHDRNSFRSPMWLFSHLVETISTLSSLVTGKEKPGISPEAFLSKSIAWFLALCGVVGVRSVEDMVWKKFPGVCSYCHRKPHDVRKCNESKAVNRNPDWWTLNELTTRNSIDRPELIDDWKDMFYEIYPSSQFEHMATVFARLAEELGELAEAVRVIDIMPSSFLSEAADIFAWLMHVANLVELKEDQTINLTKLLFHHYPDRCIACNNEICSCRPILERTVARIGHEGPPLELAGPEKYFLSAQERADRFNVGSMRISIGQTELETSDMLLNEIYEFASKLLNEVRYQTELETDHAIILTAWCQRALRLTASQLISQSVIDQLLLHIQTSQPEARRTLAELISGMPTNSFRDAFLGFASDPSA